MMTHPLDDDGYGMYKKLKLSLRENNCKCVFCNKALEHTV